MTALAKDPRRRYRSVRELAADLERHLAGETVSARPLTLSYRAATFLRRHAWATAGTVLSLVVLAAFVVALWWQNKYLQDERDSARLESRRAEAVTDYLVEAFREAHPARALGRPVGAREILQAGLDSIDQLDDEPALQNRLLVTFGDVRHAMGEGLEATELLARARDQAASVYGSRSLQVAAIEHRLGEVWLSLDRFDEATAAITPALEIRRQQLGEEHVETAESLALKGRLRYYLGAWSEGHSLLERSVQQLAELRSPADAVTLEYLGDLAAVTMRIKGRDEGIAIYEQRLETARSAFGPDHPLVADSLGGLAFFGDREQASQYLAQAVEIYERVYGPVHRDLARALHQQAQFLMHEEPERARELATRARDIDRLEWGEGSWALSLDESTIGEASWNLGEHDLAIEHMLRAVENARLGTPATRPWRTLVMLQTISALLVADRYGEVESMLEELEAIWWLPEGRPEGSDAIPESIRGLIEIKNGQGSERLVEHGRAAQAFMPETTRLYGLIDAALVD